MTLNGKGEYIISFVTFNFVTKFHQITLRLISIVMRPLCFSIVRCISFISSIVP